MWEHFPHEADMGVRGFGETKEEAFVEAAKALSALTTELSDIENRERVDIVCEAPDDEQLLVEWLDAIVFEMATRRMVFGDFEASIDGKSLRGAALGERRDPERHSAGVEVKGPTFTELLVGRDERSRWVAQCIVDV